MKTGICRTMNHRGYNEEIVELIKRRLDNGKREYGGEIDVNDGRNWTIEALEESLDLAVYISAKLIQSKINNNKDLKEMYLSELEEKLQYEKMVGRREEKIKKLRGRLSRAEQILRKAQRSVMYDEIQEYFERWKKNDNKRNL